LGATWWQLPFEEEIIEDVNVCSAVSPGDYIRYYRREVRTLRRGIWGEKIQHGQTTVFDRDGNKITEEHWSFGVLHGTFRSWFSNGQLEIEGSFRNGEKKGTWTYWNREGEKTLQNKVSDGEIIEYIRDEFGNLTELKISESKQDGSVHTVSRWNGDQSQRLEYTEYRSVCDPNLDRANFHAVRQQGWHDNGARRYVSSWMNGKLHGTWKTWSKKNELAKTLTFQQGKLVQADGKNVNDYLSNYPLKETASADNWQRHITKIAQLDFSNASLQEIAEYVEKNYKVDTKVNRKVLTNDQFAITGQQRDIPLFAALTLLFQPYGLTCVNRYEVIWITTVDDAKNLRDRTGVYQLQTSEGSRLDELLSQDTRCDFVETPLEEVLEYLMDLHPIKLALKNPLNGASLAKRPVTLNAQEITLRAGLGMILEQLDIECIVENGVVVIRPHAATVESVVK